MKKEKQLLSKILSARRELREATKKRSRICDKLERANVAYSRLQHYEATKAGFVEGAFVRIKTDEELTPAQRRSRERGLWKGIQTGTEHKINGGLWLGRNTGQPEVDNNKPELLLNLWPGLSPIDKTKGGLRLYPYVKLSDVVLVRTPGDKKKKALHIYTIRFKKGKLTNTTTVVAEDRKAALKKQKGRIIYTN